MIHFDISFNAPNLLFKAVDNIINNFVSLPIVLLKEELLDKHGCLEEEQTHLFLSELGALFIRIQIHPHHVEPVKQLELVH